jgi:glycosidase
VVDFVSVMDVYWNVSSEGNGEHVDIQDIPPRAFDDPQQWMRTEQIFARYNQTLLLTPEMDAEFAQLAAERIHAHRLRYYLGLPLARLADMWLRPRTEMLNLELNWWNWQDVPQESLISASLAALDVFYIVAALFSLRRDLPGAGMLWLFILCRSALLATLPNPEPRYTLECFPALLMLAAVGLARRVGSPRRH